jgi:hypothetical protein
VKRAALVVAIVLLLFRLVWMYVIPGWNVMTTDFPNYYTAAWAVRHGDPVVDLYDPHWFELEKNKAGLEGPPALFSVFPPFSAMVMWPLSGLSPMNAKRAWIVVSAVSLVLAIVLTARMASLSIAETALVGLLAGDALGNNFLLGQVYVPLTLLIVAAIYFKDRIPWIAGAATGLTVVTKIFPAWLMLYFAATRRWRAFIWSIAGVGFWTSVGILAMGWAPHRTFIAEALPRLLQGDLQDPYNVRWNTLAALLKRMFVAEPGWNPAPLVDVPVLSFFIAAAIGFSVLVITLRMLHRNSCEDPRVGPLVEWGAAATAMSLMSAGQSSYQHFMLFPAFAGAFGYFKNTTARVITAVAFALICSNVMGAPGQRWNAGWAMLLAFPRAYLLAVCWIVALFLLGLRYVNKRPLIVSVGVCVVFAGLSASRQLAQWMEHERDGATIARPDRASALEMFPTVGNSGLTFASLRPAGYTHFHPSAFGDGLIDELHGTVFGRLADGSGVAWSGVEDPSLGPNSVVATRRDDVAWEIVERKSEDSAWRPLLRSPNILHDPALSADDSHVAFAEFVDGHYRVVEWDRATKTTRVIFAGSGDYRHPAYSSSGRWLFVSQKESGQWDIGRLWRDTGRKEVLTASPANDFNPAVSPDERTLYFASDRKRGYRFSAIYWMPLR